MPARGNPAALALGPGYLYIGGLGRTEPTDLTTPWATVDPLWVFLGYSSTGSEFDYQLTTAPVDVAEELDPITNTPTGRTSSLIFALSQMTATNLSYALNGGVITTGSGIVTVEPPDLGGEVRVMLGFESEDHTERWVWRQGINTGQLKIMRQKGATNAVIDVNFMLEKPATGAKIFKAVFASPARA
jgi:hypothetical protein